MAKRYLVTNAISIAILGTLLLLSFVPVLMMLTMSIKDSLMIELDFWALPFPPVWSNYSRALNDLTLPAARTIGVATVSIIGITAISCVAAYTFARLRFFGKEFLFYLVIFVFLVPGVLTLTPNFVLATQLNLRDSLGGLVIFYIGGGQVFAIFLLRAFFQSQPEEMFEAARIDGAGELKALWSIAIPLARPILITIGIMNFLAIYNDLIWPLLMLNSRNIQTLTLALQNYSPANEKMPGRPDTGAMMAGYTFSSIPILMVFAFGMKYYIEGLTSGAIKQ